MSNKELEQNQNKEITSDAHRLLNNLKSETTHMNGSDLVSLLRDNFDNIDLEPWFQRGHVWSDDARAKLVDSFLNNCPIPTLYLEKHGENEFGAPKYTVIDGKQRLEALRKFICENLEIIYKGQPEDSIYKGRKYTNDKFIQNRFNSSKLPVIIIETTGMNNKERETIQAFMYLRWNEQSAMTNAQKRVAIKSYLNDVVKTDMLPFFQTPLTEKFFKEHNDKNQLNEIIEKIFFKIKGGKLNFNYPTHRQLMDFHQEVDKDEKDIEKISSEVKKVVSWLRSDELLNQPAVSKSLNRNHKIDLILFVIQKVREIKNGQKVKEDLNIFVEKFVSIVTKVKNLQKKQLKKPSFDIEESLFLGDNMAFGDAFTKGTNSKHHFRFEEMNRIANEMGLFSLIQKDKDRLFTYSQRVQSYLENGKKCQNCGKGVDLVSLEADHIEEHSLGFPTTDENLQMLCKACHKEKTRNFVTKDVKLPIDLQFKKVVEKIETSPTE